MSNGKALGMDKLTSEIFSHHWNTIKYDVTVEILHFFNNRKMLQSLNLAILTLIPKKTASVKFEDYR